ncbi:hypothetical protein AQUCO_03000204v1 [Aquilegia coerulea]|uniref:DCD domain-containing protein n=1 Tax=Aquilegia coerulea TaxID=218851 RepID=A0A2G5D1R8_AQUCA|nr:hypothetical protein AQUCO_03000204v1 [Aquilegia coerulea]
MNINPNAWTEDGTSKTQYPAQVHVRIRKQCHYLLEEQYSEIIQKNYYTQFQYRLGSNHKQNARRFRFELDHMQTAQLLSLFESSPLTHSSATFYSKASSMRRLHDAISNLDTRHEDEDLEKSAVEVSSKHCMESRLPVMVPLSARKWISLCGENSDSNARSDGDDIVSLVPEFNMENPACLNDSNLDSGPSGTTPLWEEEKEASRNIPSCWEEEAGPLGVTTLAQGLSSGITPCLDQEKQIFGTQSDKEAMDEEERIYSKLKQLAFEREKLNLKVCREDLNIPRGMDTSSFKDELSPVAPLANEKETGASGVTPLWEEEKEASHNIPSCWEEVAGPLGVTTLEEEGMSSGITPCLDQEKQIFETQSDKEATDEEERIHTKLKQLAFERENLNLKVCRENVNIPRRMDNSSFKDELSPVAPSTNEKETVASGNTPLCEEEKEASRNIPSCWEEEVGPLGVTTLGEEGMSSGITPCLDQEKQIFGTQSVKEAMYEEERIYSKLKQLAFEREKLNVKVCREDVNIPRGMDNSSFEDELSPVAPSANEKDISKSEEDIEGAFESCGTNNSDSEDDHSRKSPSTSENYEDLSIKSSDFPSVIDQLRQEIEEVKTFSIDQNRKASVLEKNLVDSENLIQQLRRRIVLLESHLSNPSSSGVDVWNGSGSNELFTKSFDEPRLGHDEDIWIMGGYDGVSWLQTLDRYSPSTDYVKSLEPMSSVRSYASAAVLNGLIYSFGGWNGYDNLWYDTVECYNPSSNKWISCSPLSEMKGCLAGATLNNKLYAVGGGNGKDCFRTVEMFDPVLGRWIVTQSMLEKRFASSAVELDGVLYVVGGFDGKNYLKSGERFDPRGGSWSKLHSMNTSRGSHALTVFKGKVYALGGYDGSQYVPTVEVFDPFMGTWIQSCEMKQSRGYFAAPVIGEAIYAIGGQKEGNDIVDSVEMYRPGHGWSTTTLNGIGKRCFFSAVLH